MIPLNARHAEAREISLNCRRDRFHHCEVFIVFDDLGGDGELFVRLMSEPEPSPDLREDVLDHFSIPKLFKDDDFVLSKLIAVRLICHSRFSFLDWCASGPPESEKAQPI